MALLKILLILSMTGALIATTFADTQKEMDSISLGSSGGRSASGSNINSKSSNKQIDSDGSSFSEGRSTGQIGFGGQGRYSSSSSLGNSNGKGGQSGYSGSSNSRDNNGQRGQSGYSGSSNSRDNNGQRGQSGQGSGTQVESEENRGQISRGGLSAPSSIGGYHDQSSSGQQNGGSLGQRGSSQTGVSALGSQESGSRNQGTRSQGGYGSGSDKQINEQSKINSQGSSSSGSGNFAGQERGQGRSGGGYGSYGASRR